MLFRSLPAAGFTAGGGWGTGSDLARGRASQTLVSAENAFGSAQVVNLVGFDAAWEIDVFGKFRRQIEAAGAAPNIPPMVNRRWKPCFSPVLYRGRNRIERFFNRLMHFRRLATRYEKHAANFLAMLKLAAAYLWPRHTAAQN